MATSLQEVAQLLLASIDPKQHKQAEEALRSQESKPDFSLSLLQLVASQEYPQTTRQSAALYFKNYIRRNWIDENGTHMLPGEVTTAIKRELVGLMISTPTSIQAQLGDAVSVIADSDFWKQWDTLIADLTSRLTADNPSVNNGVLRVAHSIFKRWRPLFRSDELYTEINHVMSTFGEPFLLLLQRTDAAITQNEKNSAVLKEHLTTLHLCMQILYDMCCQDLPALFEDNKDGIGALLSKYIVYSNPAVDTDDETESGVLEYVKASVWEVCQLFATKEQDIFVAHLGQLASNTWDVIASTGLELKYDIMVSKAFRFLTTVVGISANSQMFGQGDTLKIVIERVIIPNVTLRESDVELFEDEPIEFTRRDLEGSDSETRRRSGTELLRALMLSFQQQVTQIVTENINNYLAAYQKDQSSNWKSKDTAVYLFCSIAALSSGTGAQGVTNTNPNVNIIEFFSNNIAQDLVSASSHVLLQVDAIKYLYLFRSQLTPEQWREVLSMLVKHLGSENYVVHTYAAIALERTLTLMNPANPSEPMISTAAVGANARDLLQQLFMLMQKNSAPEKVQENEFLMKCVMRILIVVKADIDPCLDLALTNLVNILRVIRHNPSNPRYYYYLFESLGVLIKYEGATQADKLESTLTGPFQEILGADVPEFSPYIFQLLAALLEANPSASLPVYFQNLLGPVLTVHLWDARGNVPALTRLLCAMVSRGASLIIEHKQIEKILTIFQKLVSVKSTEVQAFELLETLIVAIPVEHLQQYFVTIFGLLLQRLNSSKKGDTFQTRFVNLYHLMSARDDKGLGADAVVNFINQVQPDVFRQIYTGYILPTTPNFTSPAYRKLAVISLTKTLADSQAFVDKYPKGWNLTCECLLKLMINPPTLKKSTADDLISPEQDVDDLSFGVGFTQLGTCRKTAQDPYPEVGDLKEWMREYLRKASERHNGRITTFISERLADDTRNALLQYVDS